MQHSTDGRLEIDFERALIDAAAKQGWTHYKLNFIGARGAPDRLFVNEKRGKAVFMELKRLGEEPTMQQMFRHAELRRAGLRVEWADRYTVAAKILELK